MTVSGPPQGATLETTDAHVAFVLRLADDNLVLAQRLAEWISRGPELEEDLALANFALDHLGQARGLLSHAGSLEGSGRGEDELAMLRTEREFSNCLLVEQPNGDFAATMARQFLFDAYQVALWGALTWSSDPVLGGIAAKAEKESTYHLRHSSSWVIRLGDGTPESHQRMQAGLDSMWRFTGELFAGDVIDAEMVAASIGVDPASLLALWSETVGQVVGEATLAMPGDTYQRSGGRSGFHTEHLGHLLGEMQWLARAHPGASW